MLKTQNELNFEQAIEVLSIQIEYNEKTRYINNLERKGFSQMAKLLKDELKDLEDKRFEIMKKEITL